MCVSVCVPVFAGCVVLPVRECVSIARGVSVCAGRYRGPPSCRLVSRLCVCLQEHVVLCECACLCQCVSGCVSLSHEGVTEFVRVSASVTVCVSDVPACVSLWVFVCQCVSVSVCGCAMSGTFVSAPWSVCVRALVYVRVRGGGCLVSGPQASEDMCVYSGQCLSASAWVALCGEASPSRCGCTPPCASVRVCLSVSRGRLFVAGRPQVSVGVYAPAGAEVFSLRAGGAPRAEPRARRSGAEPARSPKPQAETRRGPPPTPPPARARAARGVPEPETSGGAETAVAPVGCRDRDPEAAEPAPSASSLAPSRVRAEKQPPIPGPRLGHQQVSERP